MIIERDGGISQVEGPGFYLSGLRFEEASGSKLSKSNPKLETLNLKTI
jgi:hypothetical protein